MTMNETDTSHKGFDAVAFMRRRRAELLRELEGKSFEEQQAYIREQLTVPTTHDELTPKARRA